MKRLVSWGMLTLLFAGTVGVTASWADDRRDYVKGLQGRTNYQVKNVQVKNVQGQNYRNWGNPNARWNGNDPRCNDVRRYNNGNRYDSRSADRLREALNRQENLVNRLQARVDDLRRKKRTNTRVYDEELRRLRLAQSEYRAMKGNLDRYIISRR